MTYEGVHMDPDYIKGVNLGNWLVLEKWMNRHYSTEPLPMTNTICRRNSGSGRLRGPHQDHRAEYINERLCHHQIVGTEPVRIPVP